MRLIALLGLLAMAGACGSSGEKAGVGSGSASGSGSGSGSAGSGSGSDAPGRVLTQDRWVALFVPTVIDAACGPKDTFFRSCFTVEEAGCRSELEHELRHCIDDLRSALPPTLDKSASEAFGGRLGSCAGSAYELTLKNLGKRLSNAKCDDPKQW